MDPLTAVSTRTTPQHSPADPRQIPNSASGYAFAVGDETRVQRFLTLGVDGGTFYVTERDLTAANAEVLLRVARERGEWLVARIVEVSTAGRAPRQNPAIFALAATAAVADEAGRKAALAALPAVCRTGTHLFLFARYVEQFRGWGRGLRRAVAGWYLDRDVDDLAYQAVKYRQRDGWSHRDLLRLAHPGTDEAARRALFGWIVGRDAPEGVPALVEAFERAQTASTVAEWTGLVEGSALSWEMLPDVALGEPDVWRALITRGMPQTALLRQLPRLTRLGVLDGEVRTTVIAQLTDRRQLQRARVHPVNVLVAQRTYAAGRSVRGDSTWTPDGKVVDALDKAFYAAFGTVRPAGKRTLVALDVSGSMVSPVSGLPISCRDASAALALVTMATEPEVDVVGFTQGLTELKISPRQRLDDVVDAVSNLPFGGTDCAQPMLWALDRRKVYDTFVVYTDSETWAGKVHPHQALTRYRQRVNPKARLIVVGMAANDVSIADPADARMLDIAGFDSAVPTLISDFSRGEG